MSKCINCGDEGPHFVHPSLGEPGFFYCIPKVLPTDSEKFKAEKLEQLKQLQKENK